MSIFDIFRTSVQENYPGPELRFGRFNDAYKDSMKHLFYEKAIQSFEQGNHHESISYLFDYLRDDLDDNVQYTQHEGDLFFEIYQGSKKIIGRSDQNRFVAISEIAKISSSNIGLLRRLLDKNYLLKYAKFCINEEEILILKFDSFLLDASPQKIFHALKELAVQADKHDDLLVHEFDELNPIISGKIVEPSELVKQVKYEYLVSEINKALAYAKNKSLNNEESKFGLSYILLTLNYKLDYLLKPETLIMDMLEKNHRIYFASDGDTVDKKNAELISGFEQILARSEESLKAEFYDSVHSFGFTKSSPHTELVNLINNELEKIQWYVTNNQEEVAKVIPSYIASYGLFNFGFSTAANDLLELLLRITEQDFFVALGYTERYRKDGSFQNKQIKRRIAAIKRKNRELYPSFEPNTDVLDYSDLIHFGISFLHMVRDSKLP